MSQNNFAYHVQKRIKLTALVSYNHQSMQVYVTRREDNRAKCRLQTTLKQLACSSYAAKDHSSLLSLTPVQVRSKQHS